MAKDELVFTKLSTALIPSWVTLVAQTSDGGVSGIGTRYRDSNLEPRQIHGVASRKRKIFD